MQARVFICAPMVYNSSLQWIHGITCLVDEMDVVLDLYWCLRCIVWASALLDSEVVESMFW